jgi:hypothetical protein
MPKSPYTPDEVVRRGKELYEKQIRAQVEQQHHGEIVVIDIDSGDYEVAADHLPAARRARAKHPDGALFAVRVGYPALARIGGRSTRRA